MSHSLRKSAARVLAVSAALLAALSAAGVRAQPATTSPSNTVTVEIVAPKIRKVVFANPPANLIGPTTVSRLHEVVKELSDDPSVQVVIFASATPRFFFNHFDLRQAGQFPMLPGDPSTPTWVDLVLRLSKAPFVSIASIRGRTRGGGSELALAMDLRYASQEQALFSQPEVGTGIVPGGGGAERLPRLIGRDRALEAILGSHDYDADSAERYGWVTRTVRDAELDALVDAMANRLASFDRPALLAAKAQVNRASLPPDDDLRAAYAEYGRSLANPGFPPRMLELGRAISEKGLDVELRLGDYLGTIKPSP